MYWLLQRFFSPVVGIGIIAVLLWLLVIIGGYRYNWRWTGVGQYSTPAKGKREWHHRKTLWDWMQLLIIPAVLAGAALLFNAQNARTQQALTTDNQREAALQAYINSMSEHLLHDNLRKSPEDAEIRSVARTRTLSTLRQLDGARKGQLIQFLYESGLITSTSTRPAPIISLRDADLQDADLQDADLFYASLDGVDLHGASLDGASLHGASLVNADLHFALLRGANLRGAFLNKADLHGAYLQGAVLLYTRLNNANLRGADLRGVDLTNAGLPDADLRNADLRGAKVTSKQLATCKYLNGATLPDGTVVPEDVENPFR
jgi:uncharacterized protein YjbI with pentapeptide repeats